MNKTKLETDLDIENKLVVTSAGGGWDKGKRG